MTLVQPSPNPSAEVSSRSRSNLVLAVVLALAVVAAFHNGAAVPFLLDDEISILDNESIRKLTPLSSLLWPRSEVLTAGRPLLNLSFALNYSFGGNEVRGYHIVNILIHTLAALALFGIVRRTLLLPRFAPSFGQHAPFVALFSALLWALHPLQTVSVTYISQRAESLMGFCYLATLYGLVRTAERPGKLWPWFTVACCLMGMMVKEVMVTAPVILLLFDRTFITGSFKEAWRRRRVLYLSLGATWIVLLVLMVASRIHARGVGYGFNFAWHEYVRIESTAVLHYLRLAFYPFGLVFDYGEDVAVPSAALVVPCALLLGGLIAATIILLRRRSALGFLGCWFFLILAPTSSFLPVAAQPIAENRVYLPLAAVSVALAAGLFHLTRKHSYVGALAMVIGFTALTINRNRDYQSAFSLWADTVRKRPQSARAWSHFANELSRAGKLDEAIACYQAALRIRPAFYYAHTNLGSTLLGKQRFDEAIQHFLTAISLNPKEPIAHSNLATALFQTGRKIEALQHYQEALRVRPGFPEAQVNMGIALAHLGRLSEAVAVLEQVLRDDPHNQGARHHLPQIRALLQQQSTGTTNR